MPREMEIGGPDLAFSLFRVQFVLFWIPVFILLGWSACLSQAWTLPSIAATGLVLLGGGVGVVLVQDGGEKTDNRAVLGYMVRKPLPSSATADLHRYGTPSCTCYRGLRACRSGHPAFERASCASRLSIVDDVGQGIAL